MWVALCHHTHGPLVFTRVLLFNNPFPRLDRVGTERWAEHPRESLNDDCRNRLSAWAPQRHQLRPLRSRQTRQATQLFDDRASPLLPVRFGQHQTYTFHMQLEHLAICQRLIITIRFRGLANLTRR